MKQSLILGENRVISSVNGVKQFTKEENSLAKGSSQLRGELQYEQMSLATGAD